MFYALALGIGPFDPFDIGYRPRPLLIGLALLGVVLAALGKKEIVVVLAIDIFAYAAGLFDNLWNALFDPVLVVAATLQATRQIVLRPQQVKTSVHS